MLVLNSNAMRERAVGAIRKSGVRAVDLCLDHDRSGRELTEWLRRVLAGLGVADRSDRYAGYKDVNEYLVARWEPTATAP